MARLPIRYAFTRARGNRSSRPRAGLRSGRKAPLRLGAHLTQQPIGGFASREQEAVTHDVERRTDPWEALRSGLEERFHAVLFRQAMLRRQRKATLAHFIVILEIGATTPPPPFRHVIGEHSPEPQCIVAQVSAYEKAARCVAMVHISQQRSDGVVDLIVRRADPVRIVAHGEVDDDRRHVV